MGNVKMLALIKSNFIMHAQKCSIKYEIYCMPNEGQIKWINVTCLCQILPTQARFA